MMFGHQLEVSDGLGSLALGGRYYYCGRSAFSGVLLARFYREPKAEGTWRVGYVRLAESLMEKELTGSSPGIRSCKRQHSLPPALLDLEGVNFDELLEPNYARKKSHNEDVQHRLEAIYPLLEREQEVLQALNPLKEISRIRQQLHLKSHVYRLQYWFFCYVLHGRNKWSLKPSTHCNGTWSRESDKHEGTKFGRPHANGRRWGWPSAIFQEQVVSASAIVISSASRTLTRG